MTIYDKLQDCFKGKEGQTFTTAQIVSIVRNRHKSENILPADHCYNSWNRGRPPMNRSLFEKKGRGEFIYLGPNYPYDGKIYWEPKGTAEPRPVGKWVKGESVLDSLPEHTQIQLSPLPVERHPEKSQSTKLQPVEPQTEQKRVTPEHERRPPRPEDIYEKATRAIVGVQHDGGFGSGFIINANGLIVTNRHVIENHKNLHVKLHDGSVHNANVLIYYRDIDMAFLRIQKVTRDFMKIDKNPKVKAGSEVFAIGHPHGYEWVFTKGIISKMDEQVNGNRFIMTDAAIEPGNSGGPLMNKYGDVVGMNTMGITKASNMNFAIPVELINNKFILIAKRTTYLEDNYFCDVCYNTSHNRSYCDHCGVRLNAQKKLYSDDSCTVQCSKCNGTFDNNISVCPNCSTLISRSGQ